MWTFLHQQIHQEFASNTNKTTTLRKALDSVFEKFNIISLLQEIVDSNNLVLNLPPCYTHNNGFDKFTLIKSEEFTLRLHVWWGKKNSQSIREEEHIHNHLWDFSSRILVGSLKFRQFQLYENGQEYLRYEYVPIDHKAQEDRLMATGSDKLICAFEGEMVEGSKYLLDGMVFHQVLQPELPTATLMLHTRSQNKSALVYSLSPIEVSASATVPINLFDKETIKLKLGELIRILKD